MCNPRRITVTATRQLSEAWQREVRRSVELMEEVRGEARVRQALDASLSEGALRALEMELAAEESGWTETEQGYRYDVEGGYIEYIIDDRTLEVVATLEDAVSAKGEEAVTLSGTVEEEIKVDGTGQYYDDGYGGRTEEFGKKAADKDAQRKLENKARERVRTAAEEAEAQSIKDIEENAKRKARERLASLSEEKRAELAEQARQNLEIVGLRGQQAFHRALAQAYKNALLSWARTNNAGNIHCDEGENGEILDIEFTISK